MRTSVRILALIAGAPVLLLVIFYAGFSAFEFIEPRLCPVTQRITTSEEALAFGKRHIREDKNFWLSIGVSDQNEIDRFLQGTCCVANRGDYFIKDESRWGVFIGGKSDGRYDLQYEVFFSECGKRVRVEKLATRYN